MGLARVPIEFQTFLFFPCIGSPPYYTLFTLLTTLGQLRANCEIIEFETALKQFCDFFKKTLRQLWDHFEASYFDNFE